jgi:hypothetical protein
MWPRFASGNSVKSVRVQADCLRHGMQVAIRKRGPDLI